MRMSDHSVDASLQEKCLSSLSTDPKMDETANQNESKATSLPEPKKNTAITYLNSSTKFTDDSYSCDKSLDQINSHKVTIASNSVNRELAETDICSDLFTSHTDTLNGEVTKSFMQDRTNGLVHSIPDKGTYPFQLSCSKSLTNETQSDTFDKSNCINFEQNPTSNVPIEINTLENSAFSNEKINFDNDLKKASDEVSEKDKNDQNEGCDLDDTYTNCTDDTENSSSEQDPYDTTLDEIYHVPKTPIFNGNSYLERRSNLKRKAEDGGNEENSKKKRTIQFEGVTVFYFPRSQGFTCVPSQGGSTLGMSRRHFSIKSFSLAEHSAEQRKSHRDYLLRLRRQRNNQERKDIGSQCSSSEESEENSEEASDVSDSELEADSFFFLQPLPIRQRRALLRQSGIRQIEGLEKDECKDIRISREMCGCQCKVYCDPNSCQCSQAGIKCQVDRHSFPCGCSRDGCSNPNGRIEFNPIRVRTHFLHTLMRLEIEKCQNQHQWELQQQQKQQRGESSLDLTKVTATSSWLQPSNGVSASTFGSANGNAIGNTLPFFTSQDPSLQINPATELHPGNVGGSGIYPPFELRQMDNSSSSNGLSLFPSDSGGDYNPSGCSMFPEAVMSPFDTVTPLLPYGGGAVPFPSQSGFTAPGSYSSSHSKLSSSSPSPSSSSSSPFSISSFSYAAAAAVAVVSPPGACPYSLPSNFSQPTNEAPSIANHSPSCMSFDKFPSTSSNVYSQINFGICASQEFSASSPTPFNGPAASSAHPTVPPPTPAKLNSFSLSDMLGDLGASDPNCLSNAIQTYSQCSLSSPSGENPPPECLAEPPHPHGDMDNKPHPSPTPLPQSSDRAVLDTLEPFITYSSSSLNGATVNTSSSSVSNTSPSSPFASSPLLFGRCNVQIGSEALALSLDPCANGASLTHSGSTPTTSATPYQQSKNEPLINPVTNSPPDLTKGNDHEPFRGFIYSASAKSALGLDYLSPGQIRLPQDPIERERNEKGHLNPALSKITAITEDASRDLSENSSSSQDHQGSGLPEKIGEQTLIVATEAKEKSSQRSTFRKDSVNVAPSTWLGEINVEASIGLVDQQLFKGDRTKDSPPIEASDNIAVQNPCASEHAAKVVNIDEQSSRLAQPSERTLSDNNLKSLKPTTRNVRLGESPSQSNQVACCEGSSKAAAPTQLPSEAAERVTQSTNATSLSHDSNQIEISSRLTPTSGSEGPLGTTLPANSVSEPTSSRDNIKGQKNINILEGVPA